MACVLAVAILFYLAYELISSERRLIREAKLPMQELELHIKVQGAYACAGGHNCRNLPCFC